MSEEICAEIKAAAKALCHYPSGPSSVCSCCQGIPRCEMGAAIGEIMRLRAELATARQEGMEEAAKIALIQPEAIGAKLFNASKFRPDLLMTAICISMKRSIAAAIRAAAGEGK